MYVRLVICCSSTTKSGNMDSSLGPEPSSFGKRNSNLHYHAAPGWKEHFSDEGKALCCIYWSASSIWFNFPLMTLGDTGDCLSIELCLGSQWDLVAQCKNGSKFPFSYTVQWVSLSVTYLMGFLWRLNPEYRITICVDLDKKDRIKCDG